MYGARAYLAYLRYRAMRFFQDKILRGHGNFWFPEKKIYRSRIPINIARSLIPIMIQSICDEKEMVQKHNNAFYCLDLVPR